MADVLEDIPVAQAVTTHLAEAARVLDQAVKAGCHDPQVAYLLGLCYKGLGKSGEARQAFAKIAQPDANVYLQLGLLSFGEKAFAQAEKEFAKAWELDRSGYEAGYNVMLSRLCQGQTTACAELMPRLVPLASPTEQRFLSLLEALLSLVTAGEGKSEAHQAEASNGVATSEALLAEAAAAEESRLVQMLGGLGQFDVAYPLLRRLATVRRESPAAQAAYLEVALVQAKTLADRGDWDAAKDLLAPLGRMAASTGGDRVPRATQVALLNLLGVSCCMLQDYDMGVWYFDAALKKAGNDAWLHQNLALAHEWQGRLDRAETHWNRYFDLLDRRVPAPAVPNYLEKLAFEALTRLADVFSKKERLESALGYLQKAHRMRPGDSDTLERLYHLYTQLKRPDDARRALRRLREVRPNDPQFDLYELDLRDIRTLEDIDRMVTEIRKVLNKYPGDMRVEERALGMVGNVIPLMGRMSDQLTDQVNKIVDQMRRLPSYQINWPAVREVMRDLEEEFLKLRRITNKCLQVVTSQEHRRIIRELADHIDRKIELCHSMGG
jgi:tetratricopeptide (TPR) repeat protein